MGKRKDCRLAAVAAAGRRVKLDLFAEPSGDLGGSSGQDEVGGDNDSKNCADFPNSPSSSGQQLENPLLLLEQYSDDELEEESSKNLNHSIVENFLADFDDQENVAAGKDCEDIGTCEDKELVAMNVETRDVQNVSVSPDDLQKVEERENDPTDLVDLHKDMETEQISVPTSSDIQVAGDVGSGWKIVLHGESQRYYYWNTLSGETSWDVPDVLAQGTVSTFEQKDVADTEEKETYVLGTHKSSSPLDVELKDTIASNPNDGSMAVNSNPETKEIYEGYTGDIPNGEEEGHYLKQNDVKTSSGPITGSSLETYSPGNLVSHRQLDNALSGNGSATGADSDKGMQVIRDNEELETPVDISGLVRHAEYLLEKLTSSKRSEVHKQGHNQVSKHILELQIRLHDIKSLLSYGSSLLPFWLHSERQMKQLEAVINDEVLYETEKTWDVDARQKSQETTSDDDTKADAKEKMTMCSASEDSRASDYVSIAAEVLKESHDEAYNTDSAHTAHASSGALLSSLSDSGTGGNGDDITPKTVLSLSEDVDMDVDMEVEDAVPVSNAIVGDALGPQAISPNPPAKNESEEGFGVPPPGPPPDDEWIPPPPPDNEVFPPPPPDEPPESSFPPPPSDSETLQPYSYAEQYNLTYPVSNFEYYGQANTVPSSGYYTLAAAPHPPLYYEAAPNTYPASVPPLVNPVEPVTYYGLQNGTVPPGVESSGLHIASSYDNFGSDKILLPNTKVDVPSGVEVTGTTSVDDPFAPASGHVSATGSVTQGAVVSTPTVATTAVAATETVPKVQSKVLRNKKRTTAVVYTLKSNKKVSSLVDKWKAAKEEMHEDEEDEPENAYEFLEKKRRREIEEWRAQQIASGEAKDNANFQPVRGDWRGSGVKRKRAQMRREAVVHSPSEGLTDDGNQQQPDLTELSGDLPSGWQAYWDESSKQIYYGNTTTSETTWIKPT